MCVLPIPRDARRNSLHTSVLGTDLEPFRYYIECWSLNETEEYARPCRFVKKAAFGVIVTAEEPGNDQQKRDRDELR